jgi:hypothetical protein
VGWERWCTHYGEGGAAGDVKVKNAGADTLRRWCAGVLLSYPLLKPECNGEERERGQHFKQRAHVQRGLADDKGIRHAQGVLSDERARNDCG